MRRLAAIMLFLAPLCSCADQKRIDDLEKRISAIEVQLSGKLKADEEKQAADKDRRAELNNCIDTANNEIRKFIRMNGTASGNGNYDISQHAVDFAEQKKKNRVEECRITFGR
jgi:septal ring factor EnvC (AmiA/AmiB activator)